MRLQDTDVPPFLPSCVNNSISIAQEDPLHGVWMAIHELGSLKTNEWTIDSGCINHMISNRSTFVTFQPIKIIEVEIADEKGLLATGKGDILIRLDSGKPITVRDVFYVLGLGSRLNLLSSGQLADRAITTFFEKDSVVLAHSGTTIAKVGEQG